ncbi:MAG: hypothetical protein JWO43_613 [Candidatus Adlerbacteria bacterium]|nr:hypothetical protein [Candidatus Adlerbacteria bacterium]
MKTKISAGVAVALAIAIGFAVFSHPKAPPESVSSGDDTAVRAFVTEFGTKLQAVSLLAPTAQRKAEMDANYSAYVSPELLAAWYPEGSEALGRHTSSPWPAKIDVVSVTPASEGMYTVEGNIIEVANGPGTTTEAAAVQPVTLTVKKTGDSYRIVAAGKGSYSQLPQRVTVTGLWECLPHKDSTGPQTMECAFGIAKDQSDGHYAIDTRLMSQTPVDFPTGAHVRVTGVLTPANQLSSIQKYDIDGIISATTIEKI